MTDRELLDAMFVQMQTMQTDIQSIKQEVASIKSEVITIKLSLENETNKNIQLIAEGHLDLDRKLNEALKVSQTDIFYHMKVNQLASEIEILKQRIS